MFKVYLYACNQNLAIRERTRKIVDLKQTAIIFDTKIYPFAAQKIAAKNSIFIIAYQPLKGRRTKKYHPLNHHGGVSVSRPPRNTWR